MTQLSAGRAPGPDGRPRPGAPEVRPAPDRRVVEHARLRLLDLISIGLAAPG